MSGSCKDISFIVLAGGKSSRLGRDKMVEKIGGESLLQRTIDRIAVFGSDIIIIEGESGQLNRQIRYTRLTGTCDILPGKGPLGGIYSGLKISRTDYNFVVAGDMPFLNQALIKRVMELSEGYDAFLPRIDGRCEPLHAVYTKQCLDRIESLIQSNELSILKLLPLVNTGYLDDDEIRRYDSALSSFFNVNNEAELAEARNIELGCGGINALSRSHSGTDETLTLSMA